MPGATRVERQCPPLYGHRSTAARRPLSRRLPETILNIDLLQSGLGGESCGPATLPQYLVPAVERTFRVRLRPYTEGEATPMFLARQALEAIE